jgi:hypothetical protein
VFVSVAFDLGVGISGPVVQVFGSYVRLGCWCVWVGGVWMGVTLLL